MGTLTKPTRLAIEHDLQSFDCEVPSLNNWLKSHARKNDQNGASKTYVVCEGTKVVGYYCLANSAIDFGNATGKTRRNMPNPIPAILIGRLAVDRLWKKRGIGGDLISDAAYRIFNVADIVGVRAVLVQAIDEAAACFYKQFGFTESPIHPLTLMVTLTDLKYAIVAN